MSLSSLYGPAHDDGDEGLDAEHSGALQAKLVQCIQQSLSHYLYDNAIFLAERLHAHAVSDYSVHVLATCYHRAGKPHQAYHLLKPHLHTPENRFLFAWACVGVDKLAEAEAALAPRADLVLPTPYLLHMACLVLLTACCSRPDAIAPARHTHTLSLSISLSSF